MCLRLKYLIIVCLCIISSYIGIAQSINFRHYNEEQGLNPLYIYHISQASNGYLYLSTNDGLAYFNGLHFKLLSKKAGLKEDFVYTHCSTKNGFVFLGYKEEGISVLINNVLSHITLPHFNNSRINKIVEDKYGSVWVLTAGDGIYKITNNLIVTHYNQLQTNFYSDAVITESELFLAGNTGVERYAINKVQQLNYIENITPLNDIKINSLALKNNHLFIATDDNGIYHFKKNNQTYTEVTETHAILNNKTVKKITIDSKNNLWISIEEQGISLLTFNTDFTQIVNKKNYITLGLTEKNINSIYEDKEGSIWFGTYGNGLYQQFDKAFTYSQPTYNNKPLNITSVAKTSENSYWIGSDNGLFSTTNLEGNDLTKINFSSNVLNAYVTSLFVDKKNGLWVGTSNQGLFLKEINSKNFTKILAKFNLPQNIEINCIVEDRNSHVYIATDNGLLIYNQIDKNLSLTTTNEGLVHNNLKFLYVDKTDKLWFASYGASLFYYYKGAYEVFKDIDELKSYKINGITEDKNGSIWFSTEGDGVFKIQNNKTTHYSQQKGIASNFCYGIINDANNNIWVIHKNKFSILKKTDALFKNINTPKQFINESNNHNAYFKDVSNAFYIGNTAGLLKFETNHITDNSIEPITIISKITVNDSVRNSDEIKELPYNKYKITFEFSSSSYSYPDKVNFQYKLDGVDETWTTLSYNQRSISYPKLTDGHYTFMLRACNNDGLYNSTNRVVSFTIRPPVWKTIPFYALLIIGLVFIIYAIIYFRTKQLQIQKEKLTQQVQLQTKELVIRNQEIEKSKEIIEEVNKDITSSIKYAQRIQKALLPNEKLNSVTNDLMIYYKPRDIVSGDFYWCGEKNNRFLLASCDCTGHGVPGAFMSMIGTTLLNKIVYDKGFTSPAEILNELDIEITKALDNDTNSVTDGMEIALCSFDFINNKLYFSGAKRPLLLFRKQNNELIMHEYKADIHSIGGIIGENKKIFCNQEIDIMKGDVFYMFSDGVQDQFNNSDNKRYGTKQLKNLLKQICDLPVPQQIKKIDTELNLWKGSTQQTDDILVVGFTY